MKALDINQMETINGGRWSLGAFICGAGFTGYGTLIGSVI